MEVLLTAVGYSIGTWKLFSQWKKDKKKQQLRLFQNIFKAIYSKTAMFGQKNEIKLKDKTAESQTIARNLPGS